MCARGRGRTLAVLRLRGVLSVVLWMDVIESSHVVWLMICVWCTLWTCCISSTYTLMSALGSKDTAVLVNNHRVFGTTKQSMSHEIITGATSTLQGDKLENKSSVLWHTTAAIAVCCVIGSLCTM